jgi:hypothetical protein
MKMTAELFRESCLDFHGYCRKCDDITEWGGVEGDAEGYHCPECESESVMGVENALLLGFITITEEK